MKRPNWVVVANETRARVFSTTGEFEELRELYDFVNVGLDADPRLVHPSIQQSRDPERRRAQVNERFARCVAGYLNRKRLSGGFERLDIIGESSFLRMMRSEMGGPTRATLTEEPSADSVHQAPERIAAICRRIARA